MLLRYSEESNHETCRCKFFVSPVAQQKKFYLFLLLHCTTHQTSLIKSHDAIKLNHEICINTCSTLLIKLPHHPAGSI